MLLAEQVKKVIFLVYQEGGHNYLVLHVTPTDCQDAKIDSSVNFFTADNCDHAPPG
jgi:hypothetical protein